MSLTDGVVNATAQMWGIPVDDAGINGVGLSLQPALNLASVGELTLR